MRKGGRRGRGGARGGCVVDSPCTRHRGRDVADLRARPAARRPHPSPSLCQSASWGEVGFRLPFRFGFGFGFVILIRGLRCVPPISTVLAHRSPLTVFCFPFSFFLRTMQPLANIRFDHRPMLSALFVFIFRSFSHITLTTTSTMITDLINCTSHTSHNSHISHDIHRLVVRYAIIKTMHFAITLLSTYLLSV